MEYLTVRGYSSDEFVEKKSRFIGNIAPVTTEQEALEFIKEISQKHKTATHNTYAYILRNEGKTAIKRYSDNGEPQGTAGVPSLEVLSKEGLTDVCVVVTRYYGGIMLGAGGLVRAYSHATKLAIDSAFIMHMATCYNVLLECDYNLYQKVQYHLPSYTIVVKSVDFTSIVSLELLVHKDSLDSFTKQIITLSNGQSVPVVLGEVFADIKDTKT